MLNFFSSAVSLCAILAGVLIVLVAGVTFFEVVARYVFDAPTTWSIDISTYALFWAVFLGGAHCLREGGHVAVDVMVQRLAPKIRRSVLFVVYLSVAVFAGLIAWVGGIACIEAFEYGEVTMSVLRFPLYLPLSALPVGGTMIAIQALILATGRQRPDAGISQ